MELELIDLVNENDEVIGVINRKDKAFNTKKMLGALTYFCLQMILKLLFQ